MYILILIVLLLIPFMRMLLCNSWRLPFYILKDLFLYFKNKGWKQWHGYGLRVYVGLFGKGKTLSASHYVIKQAKKYKLNVLSNIKLFGVEYTPLLNYQQIIEAPANTIILIDEASTIFNAREWKDFNISLLFQLLQCRKQRKQLVCTSPRFWQLDKLLRDITAEVVECHKIGRFQHNQFYDGFDYETTSSGKLLKCINNKWWFVVDGDYRAYDTNELVDNIKKSDFLSNDDVLQKQLAPERHLESVKSPNRKLRKLIKKK